MAATSVIHPCDMTKVRLISKSENGEPRPYPLATAKEIIRNEGGIKALYNGIDSALLRQAVYAPVRLGLYFTLSDWIKSKKPDHSPNLTTLEKVVSSLTAGAIGAFIGTPCDLAMVRMLSDNNLPHDQRRNYKHVFDALNRVVKEEGFFNLWKGATPTMARAMSLNLCMMTTYDEVKELMDRRYGQLRFTPLLASAIAGLVASVGTLPFDNVKVRLQKMKRSPDGTFPYSGVMNCFKKTIMHEGVAGLWAGWTAYSFVIAPHAIIALLVADFLRKKIRKE